MNAAGPGIATILPRQIMPYVRSPFAYAGMAGQLDRHNGRYAWAVAGAYVNQLLSRNVTAAEGSLRDALRAPGPGFRIGRSAGRPLSFRARIRPLLRRVEARARSLLFCAVNNIPP